MTTEPLRIEIVTEPYVLLTFKGYAPVVGVATSEHTDPPLPLFIGSSSLSQGLEILREQNGGKFTGIKCMISKESVERYSKYIVGPT